MDPETTGLVEDYVRRLRRSMRGATPDVIDEGAREIRAHIDDALAANEDAGVGSVLAVLERLGPPEEYGRDLALYMMVEAGYRRWSLRHMVRSTLFWALSTVVGGLVVSLFGLAYALALAMVGAAAARHAWLLGLERIVGATDPRAVLPRPLSDAAPIALLAAGAGLLAVLTIMARWFVGQYVRRARPHTLGGVEGGDEWVERTSRRILVIASVGFVVGVAAGAVGGTFAGGAPALLRTAPDFSASPLARLSGLGLAVLLLAPVLGVAWTVLAQRARGGN